MKAVALRAVLHGSATSVGFGPGADLRPDDLIFRDRAALFARRGSAARPVKEGEKGVHGTLLYREDCSDGALCKTARYHDTKGVL
jgi:hypothetical protein